MKITQIEPNELSPQEILEFLHDSQVLLASIGEPELQKEPSKLISMKIPPPLLRAFKQKCSLEGLRYQTQIKQLMKEWLLEQ